MLMWIHKELSIFVVTFFSVFAMSLKVSKGLLECVPCWQSTMWLHKILNKAYTAPTNNPVKLLPFSTNISTLHVATQFLPLQPLHIHSIFVWTLLENSHPSRTLCVFQLNCLHHLLFSSWNLISSSLSTYHRKKTKNRPSVEVVQIWTSHIYRNMLCYKTQNTCPI